ncbi:hypothetical protein ACFWBV_24520 [Streptomyces sp. NPDC060030]|uniref:hypothetical protein n=1 Tax=Streptomyces sp. NPDC060030 TaxID=3347042 RepID=UPI00367B9E5D
MLIMTVRELARPVARGKATDGQSGIADAPVPIQDHLAYALHEVMKSSGDQWKVKKWHNRRSSGI